PAAASRRRQGGARRRQRSAGRRPEARPALHTGGTAGAVRRLGRTDRRRPCVARRAACRPPAALMQRGDIYFVSLDPTAGNEQRGTRPVLVVSPTAFNRLTRTPVVLPITTGGNFARTAGFAVELSGTRTTGVVRCDQPRALDLGARNGRRVEAV